MRDTERACATQTQLVIQPFGGNALSQMSPAEVLRHLHMVLPTAPGGEIVVFRQRPTRAGRGLADRDFCVSARTPAASQWLLDSVQLVAQALEELAKTAGQSGRGLVLVNSNPIDVVTGEPSLYRIEQLALRLDSSPGSAWSLDAPEGASLRTVERAISDGLLAELDAWGAPRPGVPDISIISSGQAVPAPIPAAAVSVRSGVMFTSTWEITGDLFVGECIEGGCGRVHRVGPAQQSERMRYRQR